MSYKDYYIPKNLNYENIQEWYCDDADDCRVIKTIGDSSCEGCLFNIDDPKTLEPFKEWLKEIE